MNLRARLAKLERARGWGAFIPFSPIGAYPPPEHPVWQPLFATLDAGRCDLARGCITRLHALVGDVRPTAETIPAHVAARREVRRRIVSDPAATQDACTLLMYQTYRPGEGTSP